MVRDGDQLFPVARARRDTRQSPRTGERGLCLWPERHRCPDVDAGLGVVRTVARGAPSSDFGADASGTSALRPGGWSQH